MHTFYKPVSIPQQAMRQVSKVNAFEKGEGVRVGEGVLFNRYTHTLVQKLE
jgi:hypothetical protein